ncbi:MAG: addiction module antidote protein [Hyphomicrobium sp.]
MSKTATAPFDTADYLETPADIAAYLQVSFEDADKRVIAEAIGAVARAHGMSDIARTTGMSRESLYKALSADGNPSFATVVSVLSSLGLRLNVETAKRSRKVPAKTASSKRTVKSASDIRKRA